MTTFSLLAAAMLAAAPAAEAGPHASPPEDLLRGPARAVIRFLHAVRVAGPRVDASGRATAAPEVGYAKAKALVAPATLERIAARGARGEPDPLAFWSEAARGRVLESFQLSGVRPGPRGTALVLVEERTWRAEAPRARPTRTVSEYLVARVAGTWRVADRRPGGTFDEASVRALAAGFDAPLRQGRRP